MTNEKSIEIVTLGRPFYLGMLYDIRNDAIIPGTTLWNPDTLKNNTSTRKQPYTGYEIVTQDSLQDKVHALGVEASLKLSLVGGLIGVSGSAKYAEDSQQTNHATRLTLKYSTTTHFEQLTMEHLGKGKLNHPDLHDTNIATHVVTGVLYGAEAFFVFDHTLTENETKSEIDGTLTAMLNKIPKFSIEGEAKLQLNEQEENCIKTLSCKFYGDFNLNKNPSTFEEAVKLYGKLPELLGDNNENAIPKKVWLTPLHLLDSKAMRIVRDISTNLIDDSINFMENLHELEVTALDLTKSKIFTYFYYKKKHLLDFVARLSELQRDLKKQMAILLPKIRGTGAEESDLLDLFKQIDSSPFNKRTLTSWLEDKKKEVAIVTSFIEALTKDKNSNITVKSSSLDDVIGDIGYDYILCLSFYFNEQNEPQLINMYNYLHKNNAMNEHNSLAWFKNHNIIREIRNNLRQFIEFAAANTMTKNMKFIVNEEYSLDGVKRAELILYENGSKKEGFIVPSKPNAPYAKTIAHDSITLEWTDLQSGSEQVIKYKIMYKKHNNEDGEKWNEVLTNNNNKTLHIRNLPSNTAFVFKVQSITDIGLSPISDISGLIETIGNDAHEQASASNTAAVPKVNMEVSNDHSKLTVELEHPLGAMQPAQNDEQLFMGGTLLNDMQHQLKLNEFCGKNNQKWKLIYKAVKHGFTAIDFHHHCDGKGPTMTIIKSQTGNYLFGAFTQVPWSYKRGFRKDLNAFLFTLTNPYELPPTKFNIKQQHSDNAVYHSGYGYIGDRYDFYLFGFGGDGLYWHNFYDGSDGVQNVRRGDLFVASNCNKKNYSNSKFPFSYADTCGFADTTFTGTANFIITDIELYTLN